MEDEPLVVNASAEDLDVRSSSPDFIPWYQRLRAVRWKCVVVVMMATLIFFLLFASISLIATFFPSEAEAKGSSIFVTGVIIAVAPLTVTVLSPIFGYLLPQITILLSITSGTVLVGAVYIGFGFTDLLPSGWIFILVCSVLRFLEGVGTALYTTAAYTLGVQLYPESMGLVIGLLEIGSGSGYAVGPVVGGYLYKAGGYKLPFLVIGGLILLVTIPMFLMLVLASSSYQSTRQLLHLKTGLKIVTTFLILLLVLSVVLQTGGLGNNVATYAVFLHEQFSLTPNQIGLVFLGSSIPYTFIAPFAGKLADKINPRIIIICGLFITALGLQLIGPSSVFPVHSYLWLSISADVLLGIGAGIGLISTFPDMYKVASARFPEIAESDSEQLTAVLAGLLSAGISFGDFLGPFVGGGLDYLWGFRATTSIIGDAVLALAVLLLCVTIIDEWLSRRSEK